MDYRAPETHKLRDFSRVAAAVLGLLGLMVLTMSLVNDAKQKATDATALSNLTQLRSELGLYFIKHSSFPKAIVYENPEDPAKCLDKLCLATKPYNPVTGAPFKYVPCENTALTNCGSDLINPQSYTISYSLSSNINLTKSGQHFASSLANCADSNCR